MVSQIENYLNCRQHFRDHIPMLIEYFVRYYGEDKRAEIEDKFSHAIYLAYRNPNTTQNYLDDLSDEISKEIEAKYLKESNTILTTEDLFECSFKHELIQPIAKYKSFMELYQLGPEGRMQRFKQNGIKSLRRFLPNLTEEEYEEMIQTQTVLPKYSKINPLVKDNIMYLINTQNAEAPIKRSFKECEELLHKIDPSITIDNYGSFQNHEQIIALNQLVAQREEMIAEYHERMKKYEPFQIEAEEDKKLHDTLEDQFYIRFVEENIDLLPPEEREAFEMYKQDPSSKMLSKRIYTIFGYTMSSNQYINAFSEEAESILKKKKPQWKVEHIKKDRISFFKDMGINLGDNYDSYVLSDETKKIWPSTDRIAKFQESRDRLLNEFNITYYTSSPAHKEAREEIDAIHMLDRADSFNASIYTLYNANTFVSPNLVKTEEGYRLYPLVVVNCDGVLGHTDHSIIHELNHLWELSLSSVGNGMYSSLCGWDILDADMSQEGEIAVNTLEEDRTKRSYELFNEIINELIAQEISKMMVEDHQFVFDSEEKVTYKRTTSYENTFFIVKDFFQEFKKEIIESRSNGNIQIIWNKVGKENFDELNELFHIFYEHFDGFKYYDLAQAIQNNEDTPQTRIYFDIMDKRDKILEKMRKYSMTHEDEHQDESTAQGVKS